MTAVCRAGARRAAAPPPQDGLRTLQQVTDAQLIVDGGRAWGVVTSVGEAEGELWENEPFVGPCRAPPPP